MTGRPAPHEAASAMLEAMRAAGVHPCDPSAVLGALLRGGIVRFVCEGDKGNRNGWARLFCDGRPAGRFGHWRLGIDRTWSANHRLVAASPSDMARIDARKAQERAARESGHREAESEARRLWQASQPAGAHHPYLVGKQLGAAVAGLDGSAQQIVVRQTGADLLIPLQTLASPLCNIQRIGPEGRKRFLPGGRLESAFWHAGKSEGAPIIAIGEGFATMAAVYLATGLPVAAAMSAGNLEAVTLALRGRFPAARLILCADMDTGPHGNLGLVKANAAAAAVTGAQIARPPRPAEWPEGKGWDFADTWTSPGGAELIGRALGLENACYGQG